MEILDIGQLGFNVFGAPLAPLRGFVFGSRSYLIQMFLLRMAGTMI
jgi:hypothetical protein